MNIREFEVQWYRKHGKHPSRIKRDIRGDLYMIGDESFNRRTDVARERVEPDINFEFETCKQTIGVE